MSPFVENEREHVDDAFPEEEFENRQQWRSWVISIAEDVVDIMEKYDDRVLREMPKTQLDALIRNAPFCTYEDSVMLEHINEIREYADNAHPGNGTSIDLPQDDPREQIGSWANYVVNLEVADHVEIELEGRGYPRGGSVNRTTPVTLTVDGTQGENT